MSNSWGKKTSEKVADANRAPGRDYLTRIPPTARCVQVLSLFAAARKHHKRLVHVEEQQPDSLLLFWVEMYTVRHCGVKGFLLKKSPSKKELL